MRLGTSRRGVRKWWRLLRRSELPTFWPPGALIVKSRKEWKTTDRVWRVVGALCREPRASLVRQPDWRAISKLSVKLCGAPQLVLPLGATRRHSSSTGRQVSQLEE